MNLPGLPTPHQPQDRAALRRDLLAARTQWWNTAEAQKAQAAQAAALHALLAQLEPQCLGLYWPFEGEFNAAAFARSEGLIQRMALALPYAFKATRQMVYRRWQGAEPEIKDECGIPSCEGAVLVPDVLLVPCVGFTREGYRLGYGGGYFDRWLAAHPGVTTIGLGWRSGECAFAAEPHDQALTVILTEHELIAP